MYTPNINIIVPHEFGNRTRFWRWSSLDGTATTCKLVSHKPAMSFEWKRPPSLHSRLTALYHLRTTADRGRFIKTNRYQFGWKQRAKVLQPRSTSTFPSRDTIRLCRFIATRQTRLPCTSILITLYTSINQRKHIIHSPESREIILSLWSERHSAGPEPNTNPLAGTQWT